MKILVVCDHFYPEEFLINDLVQEWVQMGHEVHALTQNPAYPFGVVYKGYRNRIFQTTHWGALKIYRVYTVQKFHQRVLRKILNYLSFPILGSYRAITIGRKYDRIFVYQVGPLTQAIPALVAHKLYCKRIVLWSFDIWPDTVFAYGFKRTKLSSWLLTRLIKSIYKNCQSILIPSEGFKQIYQKYTELPKLKYTPAWCIQHERPERSGFLFQGTTNFTFAGNVGKVQNLTNVILGFHQALESKINLSISNIRLNIIGDGSFLEDLKKLVQSKAIPNVIFWGRQPQADMAKYYEASDFLIISLDPDPVYDLYIPAKFQSYLQTGKPILSIMNGQVPNLIRTHDIGLTAVPDNLNDIADKFIQCTRLSADRLNTIRSNAIKLLNENFDRSKIIAQITKEVMMDFK
ncbi:MAG: glycosyltransferase family 4 protein [Bacteroidales bacterium]|nr:glycosyltransferase family 4 protein [Bacteroidales bacterium]